VALTFNVAAKHTIRFPFREKNHPPGNFTPRYKKPTDFKRKGAPSLLTAKKHYVYITCTCEES